MLACSATYLGSILAKVQMILFLNSLHDLCLQVEKDQVLALPSMGERSVNASYLSKEGGLHSTEVGLALLNQQPQVRIPAGTRYFGLLYCLIRGQ